MQESPVQSYVPGRQMDVVDVCALVHVVQRMVSDMHVHIDNQVISWRAMIG